MRAQRLSALALAALLALAAAVLPVALAAQAARLVVPDTAASDSLSRSASREDAFAQRERARLRRRAGFDPSATWRTRDSLPAGGQLGASVLGDAAGSFEVSVRTDFPEYVVWDEHYTEPMFIRVVSSADGYVTLLSGGTGSRLTILAPNDLIAQLPIRAGRPLDFPLRGWVRRGIELKPQLPAGLEASDQAVIAVVTRRPFPLPPYDYDLDAGPSSGNTISVRTFQVWLGRIPPTARGVSQALYVVRRP
jgi:hypothetical protein